VGPTNRLLAVQTFLACAAGTGLVLAASFAESQASERSAREEQARFQTLGNNLPNGMVYQIVRDFDGAMRFVYVSAGVERLNGVAAQAALKDPATFYGLVAEEDRARLAAAEEASARLMEPMEAVVRLRRPDGQLRWMRLAASPRRLADGRILWDGIQIDMTEHKQAETQSLQAGVAKDAALEALRASEERFRTLLEQAPFPLILTRGGRHIYVNRAFVRMLGLQSSEEAVGRPVEEYMSPPCRESSRERTRRRELGLPTPSELELEMLRADGAAIPVQVIVGEVQLPDGPCRMNCILDISERKRAEQALRESEARYRAITESASEAIITADGSGHIVGWNPGAEALFGYSETEARGQPLTLVVPTHRPARRPAGGGWLWRAAPRVAGRTLETPGRRKDGSEFPVELSLAAWEIAGHPLYTAIIRDITARVEAEAQRDASQEALRQAQKTESLGVLAGGVAHDFNNLLTAMLGQTSLALANLPPDSAARGPIEKAVNAALRAADLTRQMLAYSGRGRFAVQPLSLNALIEQNLSLLEVAIPKHVRVRRELADPLPLIRADAGQMQQVLMNLIINAAEAISTRPGTVTIGTGTIEITERDARLWRCATSVPAAGRYVMLQVADDGCGMSPETLARIFDPFFSTKFTGRGLGLAAVLGIVSGHQGGLRVDSQPGAGTTFQLAFPAAADEEQTANAPVAAPTAAPEGANHACVLVIDDEAPVREALVDILEASGLRVLTAEDGAAGVALYAGQAAEIGLIVLDLSMPGQSGEETFKQLRALNPQVRILVSSGYDGSEVAARFTGLSFTGFLQKPYSRETLTQAVWLHLPGCR
jgi:PAS domain S-box-containing protein